MLHTLSRIGGAILREMKKTRRSNGEGAIYQRKDGRWAARIQIGADANGKPIRKDFYGKNRKEVTEKLRNFQLICPNAKPSHRSFTVQEYVNHWLTTVKAKKLKPSSFDREESTVKNQINPRIGNYSILKLTAPIVQQEMMDAMLEEGYSHSSIKKAYDTLNACMDYARRNQIIPFNPIDAVVMPSVTNFEVKSIEFFTEEEKDRFIETAGLTFGNGQPMYRYGAGLALMLYTGMRPGEAIGLTWDQVDFESRILTVKKNAVMIKNRKANAENKQAKNILLIQNRTKRNKQRIIYLTDAAINALEVLKASPQYSPDGHVICTRNRTPVRPRGLQNALDHILERAGLAHRGLHSLRHTFATLMFAKNVPLKVISEILGHATTQITIDTYIHVLDEDKINAMKAIEPAQKVQKQTPEEMISIMEISKKFSSKDISALINIIRTQNAADNSTKE